MSHLLQANNGSENTTATPSRSKDDDTPESPMLLNALKLAARSGSGSSSSSGDDSIDENSEEGLFSPLPMSPPNHYKSNKSNSSTISNSSSNEHSIASSYANSIEAMAATAEAAAINRQRPRRSPKKKSPKKNTKNKKGGGGVQYQGTRKQLFSSSSSNNNSHNMMRKKRAPVPKLTAGHLVAIIILVPFVMMEAFLSVLVFTYNYNGISVSVVGGGLTVATNTANVVGSADDLSDVGVVNILDVDDVAQLEEQQEQQKDTDDDKVVEGDEENDVVVPSPPTEDADVGSADDADHEQAETENDAEIENTDDDDDEHDVDTAQSNIVAMQFMLKEALTKLNDTGSDKQHGKKAVETLCLTVWSRGLEALSSLPNGNDDEDNDTWNALAMDAQRCLGGAELVYLSRDIKIDSVRKAKVIFESLSDVDPDNANVRAGLGTSLLILGVMKEDVSFLKLALFHLKAASSLCQNGPLAHPQPIFQSESSAMSAAILHNLALASIALGDDVSPVSLLLRSEAIRRQMDSSNHRPANLFWNCHHDALLTIEQQAVLMGAKSTMRQEKKRKSKIPFLSDRFGKKASA